MTPLALNLLGLAVAAASLAVALRIRGVRRIRDLAPPLLTPGGPAISLAPERTAPVAGSSTSKAKVSFQVAKVLKESDKALLCEIIPQVIGGEHVQIWVPLSVICGGSVWSKEA